MSFFVTILTTIFLDFFKWFGKLATYRTAMVLAAVATFGGSIAILKLALYDVWHTLVPAVLPTVMYQAFNMVLPSNTGTVIASIILVDFVVKSWKVWRTTYRLAVSMAMNGSV